MDGGVDSGQQTGACQAAVWRWTVNRRITSFWGLGGRGGQKRLDSKPAASKRKQDTRAFILKGYVRAAGLKLC